MQGRGGRLALYAAALTALVLWVAPAGAATLAPGFDDRPVTQDVEVPIALAFTPQGRLLIAQGNGVVRAYSNGALEPQEVVNLGAQICNDFERGLMGLAVDPAYETNGYVYLYYSYKKHGVCGSVPETAPVNRVSRFVMRADGTLDPGSETALIDNIPGAAGVHNGGDLQFGPDELLYVSVGDGGCDYAGDSGCQDANDASRDHHVLLGKILRIERDGSIPLTNPYQGPGTARCAQTGKTTPGTWCRETWASGLRNPFRIAFDPDAEEPRLFINDVGGGAFEEVNLGVAGADYGWNVREGNCYVIGWMCGPPPAGMTDPIHFYHHPQGCSSITGGAFVPDGAWSQEFDQDYLYADFVCGKIFRLSPAQGGGFLRRELVSGLGFLSVISMVFGPDTGHGDGPSLYYATWGESFAFEVRRISHTANRAPVAQASAIPANGGAPLGVQLSSQGTEDPDGDPVTYSWSFGDGTPNVQAPQASHSYAAGTYSATLTARDNKGGVDTTQVRIDAGNDPPEPRILDSVSAQGFSVNEQIHLVGSAVDPQDGELEGQDLEWTVVRKHNNHVHPYLPATAGAAVSIVGPQPEGFSSTQTSHLIVSLTATDSRGLRATVTKELPPHLVRLRFRTQPLGLNVEVAGQEVNTTTDLWAWKGWSFDIGAPDQRDSANSGYVFQSWSDGGAREHTIAASQPVVYTARFEQRYVRPLGATPVQVPLVPAMTLCSAPNRVHGPPLAYSSCNPPVPESGHVTVGTPDVNGHPARSVGHVRLDARVGSPETLEDEADVGVGARLTDVRSGANADDYSGELRIDLGLQVTDRLVGVDEAATGSAHVYVPMQCVPTSGPEGSTCTASTSLDAVMPGLVREGQHNIWELGKIRVFDGGPDGLAATEPNFLFATQGVFVP